jgi:hypothetical protein
MKVIKSVINGRYLNKINISNKHPIKLYWKYKYLERETLPAK